MQLLCCIYYNTTELNRLLSAWPNAHISTLNLEHFLRQTMTDVMLSSQNSSVTKQKGQQYEESYKECQDLESQGHAGPTSAIISSYLTMLCCFHTVHERNRQNERQTYTAIAFLSPFAGLRGNVR